MTDDHQGCRPHPCQEGVLQAVQQSGAGAQRALLGRRDDSLVTCAAGAPATVSVDLSARSRAICVALPDKPHWLHASAKATMLEGRQKLKSAAN